MKREPEILFALESLPALIGERQFAMLCEALKIDEAMRQAKVLSPGTFDEGSFAAHAIQRQSEHRRADLLEDSRKLETHLFEGKQS